MARKFCDVTILMKNRLLGFYTENLIFLHFVESERLEHLVAFQFPETIVEVDTHGALKLCDNLELFALLHRFRPLQQSLAVYKFLMTLVQCSYYDFDVGSTQAEVFLHRVALARLYDDSVDVDTEGSVLCDLVAVFLKHDTHFRVDR